LEKNKLVIVPFIIGILLLVYSWFLSYPLYAMVNDLVFYHVSIFYWVSLPLILGSAFVIAITTKNNLLKWIISVGIVLVLYSLFYFYPSMPTSDSQFFRGLNQYFIQSKSLDASQINHTYFQWPSFFILTYIVTAISGLSLEIYEFVMFTVVGILLSTALYVYFFKKYSNGACYAVVAFFITMYLFLNYQAVPFSLAIGFFFVLLMIDFRPKNIPIIVTGSILYIALLLTHVFVPLFFVIYLLIRSYLNKSRLYLGLFLSSLASYLLVQFVLAKFALQQSLSGLFTPPQEYTYIASSSIASATVPFDVTAQLFSRIDTVGFALFCIAGFIILTVKGRLSVLSKALLITGVSYTLLGAVVNTLGWRAISIAFIPIALGAAYLLESKYSKYLKVIFLILLLLFVFVPIHQTFGDQINYQTTEAYQTENFFVNHYNLANKDSVLMGFRAATYISPKLSSYIDVTVDTSRLQYSKIVILTSELLGENSMGDNVTVSNLLNDEQFNQIYSNGYSYILVQP
jgi:hypothetical protein